MANRKNNQTRSKVERLVDIMFSDVEIPAENMTRMRAWLVDPDKADEKSDALYGKFNEIFRFNPEPVLAQQLWPDLARRLGMDETPVAVAADPLGLYQHQSHSEPAHTEESAGERRALSFGKIISRVAAVLVPLLVVGGVALWFVGRGGTNIVEISVPMGETRSITLPDGSVLEAAGGATISYDEADFAANRLVTLSGEALFNVTANADVRGKKSPFTVEADNLKVNVLGTVFRLSAGMESDNAAQVSLYEGSVGITIDDASEAQALESAKLDTVLAAGERLTVNTLTGEHTTELIPASEMAEQGFKPLLRFDEATLGDVVMAIEMNHDVKFNIADGIDLTEGHYSGNFENLPLDEVLEMLSKIDVALSFERNGDGRVDVKRE